MDAFARYPAVPKYYPPPTFAQRATSTLPNDVNLKVRNINHMAPSEEPILFLWSMSPWASKIRHYLALRGIPYSQCFQPITMPRPDLAALGVKYRRIPVLAVGRDIYCDTLLILQKLEEWYPRESGFKDISAVDPTGRAMERLLEKWTDVVVFGAAAAAIPGELELCKDEKFQKDREELWGRPWTAEEQDRLKPAALANLMANFDFLEDLLGDGRLWVLGSDGPGLADVHGQSSSCHRIASFLLKY